MDEMPNTGRPISRPEGRGPVYPRLVRPRLEGALSSKSVVVLAGPWGSGTTTLARAVADERMMRPLDLNKFRTRELARTDPVRLIRGVDRVAIDDIQRAPELLGAIRQSIDADPRPGRFLLTAPANLRAARGLAGLLDRRATQLQLYPLAQAEIRGSEPTLLASVFRGRPPVVRRAVIGTELEAAVLAGGYPDALHRVRSEDRRNWFLDNVYRILKGGLQSVGKTTEHQLKKILSALAVRSGQIANYSKIGIDVNLSHITTQKYADFLESLFLIKILRPWQTEELTRLIRTPKIHFLDSGLLAALRSTRSDYYSGDVAEMNVLMKSFVLSELLKLASFSEGHLKFSHFSDKERNEVDFVVEDRRGRVVGFHVTARATVSRADFAGLRRLREVCGQRFRLGLVLHDHDLTVQHEDRLFAVPISALWN